MRLLRLIAMPAAMAVGMLAALTPLAAQRGNPADPRAVVLPESGRLNGSLDCIGNAGERFGHSIWPLGDVDDDGLADWILTHRRCDTSYRGYAVVELLLYHGVARGLPKAADGHRIGPSEILTDGYFLGAGDWDADGFRDIAILQRIIDDPFTNRNNLGSVVVFWNDRRGRFSVADTTHLTAPGERLSVPGADVDLIARAPERCDFDGDGVDDLLVRSDFPGVNPGVFAGSPQLAIIRGRRGARWGRDGRTIRLDWTSRTLPYDHRVSVLDHDGDGSLDIVLLGDRAGDRTPSGIAGLHVHYGVRGALPETAPMSVIYERVDAQWPMASELIDVTGDRVPELIIAMCDSTTEVVERNRETFDTLARITDTRKWLVYVGRRGQRIAEQYGSGNDAPSPDDTIWWGRPWVRFRTPPFFDTTWSDPHRTIFDPGDLGLDGVGDFCGFSPPTLACYNGGEHFDLLIDAMIRTTFGGRIVPLGTIDGTSRPALAVSLSDSGVAFYKAALGIHNGGIRRPLPEGTGRPVPSSVSDDAPRLEPTATPSPSRGAFRLRWTPSSESVTISLGDLRGRELQRWIVPGGESAITIATKGMPGGLYTVTLSRARSGAKATIVIAHVE